MKYFPTVNPIEKVSNGEIFIGCDDQNKTFYGIKAHTAENGRHEAFIVSLEGEKTEGQKGPVLYDPYMVLSGKTVLALGTLVEIVPDLLSDNIFQSNKQQDLGDIAIVGDHKYLIVNAGNKRALLDLDSGQVHFKSTGSEGFVIKNWTLRTTSEKNSQTLYTYKNT